MADSQPTDDMARLPPAHCTKIFVQRDYSDGTAVKFQTKFPQELEGKIERHIFEATVHELNAFYTEAETFSTRICCENCLACLTAYVVFLCMDTHYEKILKKIGRYIQEQNDSVYIPRGLLLIDRLNVASEFWKFVSWWTTTVDDGKVGAYVDANDVNRWNLNQDVPFLH